MATTDGKAQVYAIDFAKSPEPVQITRTVTGGIA